MKRMINFGSIEQFRNSIANVNHMATYIGVDENDKPVYNFALPKPKITAIGTEKVHGTNAAVCYSIPDGLWVQSRENIITLEKDNAGCAFFVENTKEKWLDICKVLAKEYDIDLNKKIVSVFFEWSGGNIQKNSAVSGLDKRAFIFQHFKVSSIEHSESEKSLWFETKNDGEWIDDVESKIFNVMKFPTYSIEINFEQPLMSQNKMIELVQEIEKNSPIGKSFGIENNIGEGIVFTFIYKNTMQRFKVKGELHSNSNVKTLKVVDEELEAKKINFANYACKAWRLEQAWQKTFGIENCISEPDIKLIGNFLKAVTSDVIKEEMDVMVKDGLEPKSVMGYVTTIAKKWFNNELNNYVINKD